MTLTAAIFLAATILQKSGKNQPFVGCARHISRATRRDP
jgi:hypothetical protein